MAGRPARAERVLERSKLRTGSLSVALVCPYDLTRPGGVQTQVLGLATELGLLGHDACVLAPGPSDDGPPCRPAVPAETTKGAGSVSIEHVGRSLGLPANGSRAPVAVAPGAGLRVLSRLRGGRFDVVHVHEPMAPLVGLAAAGLGPKPVVATFHRSGSDLAYRLEARMLSKVARRLAAVVAVSEAAAATAATVLGLSGIEVIPNGVRLGAWSGEHPAPNPNGPRRIAFVGRHERRKGLGVLLEAFSRLQHGAELDVMGEGPETRPLRARWAGTERICWLGQVDDATKAAVLSSSDLLVAPSLGGESFGVVLLEAMAAGIPVVASDIPGYRAAAGGAAALVPPGDALSLAAELDRLLEDGAARVRLRVAGLDRAAQFSMAEVARRYVEVYEGVVSRTPT
ncbi:MAG: glycosyltransferase family 4 protein [Acidimicrobiales bacterium]